MSAVRLNNNFILKVDGVRMVSTADYNLFPIRFQRSDIIVQHRI